MRTIHFLLILSAVSSSAFARAPAAAEQDASAGEALNIGWDAGPNGRIKAVGDPIERREGNALIAPIKDLKDGKVFGGPVDPKKNFVGVEVSFKVPKKCDDPKKCDYRIECDVKHEPNQTEAPEAPVLKGRRMKAGLWEKVGPEEKDPWLTLERHKGRLYTLKADVKKASPGAEAKMVFAFSKTMRFSSCKVVVDDGLGVTAGRGRSSSGRKHAK